MRLLSILLSSVVLWVGVTSYKPELKRRVIYNNATNELHAEYLDKDGMGVDSWYPCTSWDEEECYKQAIKDLYSKRTRK